MMFLLISSLLVGIGIFFVIHTVINFHQLLLIYEDSGPSVMKSYFIPFHFVITLVSSVILCALAYVSWKKYRALQSKEKRRDLND